MSGKVQMKRTFRGNGHSAAALLGAAACAVTGLGLSHAPAAAQERAVSVPSSQAEIQAQGLARRLNRDRGYIGPSYLQIPSIHGSEKGGAHKGWLRAEAHYWKNGGAVPRGRGPGQGGGAGSGQGQGGPGQGQGQGAAAQAASQGNVAAAAAGLAAAGGARPGGLQRRIAFFTYPAAPKQGKGAFVMSVDKRGADFAALANICKSGAALPEMTYAVSAERSRSTYDGGMIPAGIPEYFHYRLKNVRLSDCVDISGAPEGAFTVSFDDIEWLNAAQPANLVVPTAMHPAVLSPLPARLSGESRAWVATWVGFANDVADDQCPKMNVRPSQDDYYTYMQPEEAAKLRVALKDQGGPNYQSGQMGERGPNRINVTLLPGVVPDPGFAEPQTKSARGLNLDGDNGRRAKHANYASADGKISGIDNQIYRTLGCVAAQQGHKGFITQFANNQMRDGELSILLQLDGIDDLRNDPEVYLTLSYSHDDLAKSSSGSELLPDYTFRITDDDQLTPFFTRVKGRIRDGVLITDKLPKFQMFLSNFGDTRILYAKDWQLRLELKPEGKIAGVFGGYRDWREMPTTQSTSGVEFYFGYQQPGLYNALRRNADGIKDPVTGEYDGISFAYDIEAVPAFAVGTALASGGSNGGKETGAR